MIVETDEVLDRAASAAERLAGVAADGALAGPLATDLSRISTEVSDLVAAYRRLRAQHRGVLRLARHDELTGLLSHGHLVDRLDEEFRRAVRYDLPLSLVLASVDGLTRPGDTPGFLAGNDVVRRVARLLRKNSRDTDLVARYGRQEFAVVLPQTARPQASLMAERLRGALIAVPGSVRVTLGVAALDATITSALDLLMDGERALSLAKTQGEVIPWIPGNSPSA